MGRGIDVGVEGSFFLGKGSYGQTLEVFGRE